MDEVIMRGASLFPNVDRQFGIRTWIVREVAYACLMSGLLWLAQETGLKLFPVLMVLSGVAWISKAHAWQARIGLAVFCAGGSVGIFLYNAWLLFISLLNVRGITWQVEKWMLPFLVFILFNAVNYSLHQFIEVNPLSLPFWLVSFVSPIGLYAYFTRHPLSESAMIRVMTFMLSLALFQCLIASVQLSSTGGIASVLSGQFVGDGLVGTFSPAGSGFSVFLVEALLTGLFLIFHFKERKKSTKAIWLTMIVATAIVFVADDKSIELSFLGGLIAFLILAGKARLANKEFRVLVLVFFAALLIMPFAYTKVTDKVQSILGNYVTGSDAWQFGKLNRKVEFYINAFNVDDRQAALYLLGYGPGTCGSRAANMRATDTLYKDAASEANALKGIVPPYSSQCTRAFLAPLYDVSYASTASGRSAILGNPFAAWPALMLEMGLFGVGLFVWFLAASVRYCNKSYYRLRGAGRVFSALAAINLIAMSIYALVAQGFESPYFTWLIWFSLAMVHNAQQKFSIEPI